MSDIVESYMKVMTELAGAASSNRLSVHRLRPSPWEDRGEEGLRELLADFTGDGWLECVDAIRYRAGVGSPDWIAPIAKTSGPFHDSWKILAGEVVSRDGRSSVQIRHHHIDVWRVRVLSEDGTAAPIPSWDETIKGTVRTRGKTLDLKYRTYWSVGRGHAHAVRFLGFAREA